MSVPVKVNVKTTINGEETFELVVFGQYQEKNHAAFLQYEEVMEEGSVRTIIKAKGDEVLIMRSGAVNMRLPFKLHQQRSGRYETSFAWLEAATWAQAVQHGPGFIEIVYDFTLQGNFMGTYQLEISFQEEKK